MKKKAEKIYLGLNVGTNSIGYAVTDEQYNLLKFNGNDAWGSIVFDAASSNEDRRNHRLARRNLDRRQQRIVWLQEIFAKEISKVDDRFFIRLSESFRWREDVQDQYVFFNDKEYTDVQYMKENPTIHHLICELMDNKAPHDVRLVYLACAWLIAHRGHFLNNLNVEKLDEIMDISSVYQNFINYFTENGYKRPWGEIDVSALAEALKRRSGVTAKTKELLKILLNGKKPEKSGTEEFPFSQDSIIRLLAGGQCKLKDVFCKEEYLDLGSISLDMDEDKFGEISGSIGEDYDLLMALRGLYDWSVLADLLNGHSKTISAAKVQMYEQHKEDLRVLKYFMHKYLPGKYNEVFRKAKADNYVAYTGHMDKETASQLKKKANVEDFSRYIQKLVRSINPEEKDQQTKNTWLYCDEFHLLTQTETSAKYTKQIWKRARKWNGIPTGITQQAEDMLKSSEARAIINNSDFMMMLNLDPYGRMQLQQMFGISNTEIEYVTSADSGQGLIYNGSDIIPFKDDFPTDTKLYKAMTTKPDEVDLENAG